MRPTPDACRVLLLVLLVVATPTAVAGQPDGPRPEPTPDDLERFFDGAMATAMAAHDVSGATVSVVADGEVAFAKGYGAADRANGTPVRADRTLFRVGSVSKLFAWTAVAQRVEAGSLDRDADVNRYLDFEVPATFEEPVTLDHLVTHTAGFEDRYRGTIVEDRDYLRPLGEELAANVPARVRPPGELAAYSNYGAALAGYVVQRDAGVPFEEYVDSEIFEPLGMANSTFRQPVPDALDGRLSTGYTYRDGAYEPGAFEYVGIPPAGSMSATATDVAQFMLAFLGDGSYEGGRILEPASVSEMLDRQFAHDPGLNGMAFGFYEMDRNGVRVVGHGGDTQRFHSLLALVPDADVGLFLSTNTAGGAALRQDVFGAFVDRYFPGDADAGGAEAPTGTVAPVVADGGESVAETDGDDAGSATVNATATDATAADLDRFAGTYRPTRTVYTTWEKVATVGSDLSVSVRPDGTLVTSGLMGSNAQRWAPAGETHFTRVDGEGALAFRTDAAGRPTHLFLSDRPPVAYVRVGATDAIGFHVALLGLSVLLFLSAVVAWPSLRLWRWRTGGEPPARRARLARWTAGLASLLAIGFLAGLVAVLAGTTALTTGPTALLRGVLVVGALAVVAGIATIGFAGFAWRRGFWSRVGRVHYSLVALAALAFGWLLWYWNLLGFQF